METTSPTPARPAGPDAPNGAHPPAAALADSAPQDRWSSAPAGPGRSVPRGGGTAIRSVQSVRTLLEVCGDHRMTHLLCQAAATYEELAALPLGELAGRLGAWAVQLQLPPEPVAHPDPPGVYHITRYDPRYPAALGQLEDPPVLIQVAGSLPQAASVTVGGTRYPGAAGRETAAASARAAASLGAPIAAVVDGGCGQAALAHAAACGAAAVAVTPYRLDRPGVDDLLISQILATGGAALSMYAAAGEEHEVRMRYASRMAAALSPVAVLAELGVYAGGGVVLARTAVALGRYLIVPAPQTDLATPVESSGGPVLARARRFSDEWFGTSSRIENRVLQGRPAADAVVSTYPELQDALRWGLGVPGR